LPSSPYSPILLCVEIARLLCVADDGSDEAKGQSDRASLKMLAEDAFGHGTSDFLSSEAALKNASLDIPKPPTAHILVGNFYSELHKEDHIMSFADLSSSASCLENTPLIPAAFPISSLASPPLFS
jgi:hypothetical protein